MPIKYVDGKIVHLPYTKKETKTKKPKQSITEKETKKEIRGIPVYGVEQKT